jgi:hypothetical protein
VATVRVAAHVLVHHAHHDDRSAGVVEEEKGVAPLLGREDLLHTPQVALR